MSPIVGEHRISELWDIEECELYDKSVKCHVNILGRVSIMYL
jgi:hypothetical protein